MPWCAIFLRYAVIRSVLINKKFSGRKYMSWIEIDFSNISNELLTGKNIIYGAGENGKRVYRKLKECKIPIEGFYDDDVSRWGEEICDGKRIYSYEELKDKNIDDTNYILASVFISEMEKRAGELGFKRLYGVYNLILNYCEEAYKILEYKGNQHYLKRQDKLKKYINDEESLKYFDVMYETIVKGKALHNIKDIFCPEDIYFLTRIKDILRNAVFVDCGAFKGDTLAQFLNYFPDYKCVYCFEADRMNYAALQKYADSTGKSHIICENYALWNCETTIGLEGEGVSARTIEKSSNMIQTMTIDKYFNNVKVDFIKMDIEGAELNALEGGMNVIRRDRPVLAICIYHTMDDRLEIPEMLINLLEDYEFLIRHHGYSYCDSVLYGIPMEKRK